MTRTSRGVLTVFFALLSPLFLAVLSVLIEAVRVQGCRVKAANAAYLANFSVFGEYEQKLLEDYHIFAVDGACGTGDFSINRIQDRFRYYLKENLPREASLFSGSGFDPWQLALKGTDLTGYTLLTDSGCENFYQQAVAFMRETSVTGSLSRLLAWQQEAEEAKEKEKQFEERQNSSDQAMEGLEQEEEKLREDEDMSGREEEAARKFRNPLPALRSLKKQGILAIAVGQQPVSEKAAGRGELASRRGKQTGNLPASVLYGSLADHLFFREYLLSRFACFTSRAAQTERHALGYELEYILAGRTSDKSNLTAVLKSLLLLREGYNYAWCVNDPSMNLNAGTAAVLLAGWTGIPVLVSVMKHALLLSLSYAESLLDLRTLMSGGKVPLIKSADSWTVTPFNLADIVSLLTQAGGKDQQGLSYREYLRLLLCLGPVSAQKERAVDLVELNLRLCPGLSNFRADHCVVAVRDESLWQVRPLFGRVAKAFLGRGGKTVSCQVRSGFSYLIGNPVGAP